MRINQSTFSNLWRLFQITIGATFAKRRLLRRYYNNESSVLEVGCSLGNLTPAFAPYHNMTYLGVDIDSRVIGYAKKSFRNIENVSFVCADLRKMSREEKFDLVMLPGMLHHVSDELLVELLRSACELVSVGGRLLITDPLETSSSDPLMYRIFMKLEQGKFLRSKEELDKLVSSAVDLELLSSEVVPVYPTFIKVPKVCDFRVYYFQKS
ncbi:conserved hypothetical protein [Halobacteriovorax marinus SJ]|uniref:Methyltransferase domain-containing protein n=1 Tax=Halobacteriovorax marinus (strain ATCC BAA-682 / DSM 15412 / SJ) TaxID=862908 RepID=E1X3G3_HALMS|nr:class I SAM-dependent methyltransferase [Halobacteriovorax marinus]CBW25258.1 conserved hypothetical protein [Halobacteriovorax marinus SJ]